MPHTADIVIIGGGVIGCSIAYWLAKAGMKPLVLERDRLGSGASRATAGVVGPLWHIDHTHPEFFNLGLRSLELYAGLAAELTEAGVDPQFRQWGVLKLAFSQEEAEQLKSDLSWQNETGLGLRWLDAAAVRDLQTGVAEGVVGGVFSPNEGSVRGQRLVDALAHAASRLGAAFVEQSEVVGLEFDGNRIVGARTATDVYHSDHTVLAAGPWTGILDRWLPGKLPVVPVKGQRILLRKPGFLLGCPVRNFQGYVVPRVDGTVLAASTREEGVFDARTTAEGVRYLIAMAAGIFPELKDADFLGARAGVRPGWQDGLPIMGPVPGWEGISVASGHDSVGVMLSPGTAELMTDYITTGDPEPLEPFGLSRFERDS